MRSAGVNDSLSSEEDSAEIGKPMDSQISANTQVSFINNESRSRYSMNYQSYEATRIQPGEQTRRMLDYMFPGYQKRDPRNWYEMQTQTDLGGNDVNSLIGTELMEGEPIESYEDRKKSIGDSIGDDISDYDGSPAFEKKAATKKGHRSSVLSRAWEGPPIKMSGKSSQEGFHLEVDDYYHEPQTILVPREIIEHQELKMDIVPDDQGVPKVIIYLGRKDPSDPVVQQESPADTIVLFDGKEEFDRTSSDEESPEPTITRKSLSVLLPSESEVSSEEVLAPKEPPAGIRDSLDVVLSNVLRAEPEELEPSEHSSTYELLEKGQRLNNSVFLEPIKATGSHVDVHEEVIITNEVDSPSPSSSRSLSPSPKEPTPPPKQPSPPPIEPSPPPKEPSPPPKEPTPPPKDPTPPPREPSPPPKQPPPPPKQPSPPLEEPATVKSISIQLSSPEPSPQALPSPDVSVESIEHTPPLPIPSTLTVSPPPVAKTSIPSQTSSHIGSPPDRLFGPLENYPDDLEEESDKAVHSPPKQMPSPSRGEEHDHPLKLSDDYPPQYSSSPREGSDVSNWLETNILNQARENTKSSSLPKSPQKLLTAEPQASFIQEDKPTAPKSLFREPEPEEPAQPDKLQGSLQKLDYEADKPKPKAARFMDDERLSHPRALEERFSVFYPPKKPNKRKTESTAVDRTDETAETGENEAVDGWLEDEILNPAAVDNWVDTKILREAKKSSERKEIPQISVPLRPVNRENELIDAWVEDELVQPAKVDNWVSNKIMKPGEKLSKEAKKESPPPLARPTATLPSPTSPTSSLSISPDSSASSTSGQSFYKQTSKSPQLTESPPKPPPPPTAIPTPIVCTPPIITPPLSTLAVERRESRDKSVDVNEEEVDSWINDELLGPAEACAWVEKKVVRPAQAEKWVDHQVIKDATAQNYVNEKIMKPASALSYVDEKIMKPSAIESYIDEKIIEPAKTESYLDRKMVKTSEAETWTDSEIIEKVPAKEPSPELKTSTNVTSDMSPEKLTFSFPAPDESLLTGIKTPEKETPIETPDRKVTSVGKPTKQFQVPETYLSDMNLLGPFQPHLDTPDEYLLEPSRRLIEPTPKPVEEKSEPDYTKMFPEDEPETGSPKMPVEDNEDKPETRAQEVQTYPTVEKAKTIDTTVQTHPTEEKSEEETSATKMGKSPKQSPHGSLLSIDRKPSLKKRSGSVDISSMKLHDVEPEKRDRSSILAKKAMEADNYLLRDDEDDYIHPKTTSGTSIPGKRSKSSTSSRKLCPLTSLFKKKRSSSPGPALFIPPHKRNASVEEGSGKYTKSVTSIYEEVISLPTISETTEETPVKDQIKMNLVPPSGELPEPDGMSEIPSGKGKKLSKSKEKEGGTASESLSIPHRSISTTSKSSDHQSSSDVPTIIRLTQSPSQVGSPPQAVPSTGPQQPSQFAPSLPVSASPIRAAPPPQANIPLGLQVDATQDERPMDIDFPKKTTLVMPEDLLFTFPTFSDNEEAMKNQKKPENDIWRKSVPNPAKGGVPVFPDYKQLTEPQNQSIVDEESGKDHGVERFEGKDHTIEKPKTPLVASALQGDAKLQEIPLKDFTKSEVLGEKKPKDIKQFEPQKDSEKIKMDSSLFKPDTHCSAEPTPPGNGIPEFLDYKEITLGQDYVGLKPQNETKPRIDQLSASPQKRSLPPQETFTIHESTTQQKQTPSNYQTQPISVTLSVPKEVPQTQQPFKTSTSISTQTASSVEQPEALTYGPYGPSDLRQSTSLKKYEYSQPDKPLQLVSTPDYTSIRQIKLGTGEHGVLQPLGESHIQMPPLQKEVPSTFDRRVQQPASLGLRDSAAPQFPQNYSPTPLSGAAGPPMAPSLYGHAERPQTRGLSRPDPPQHHRIPSPDGYISIKQRTDTQSIPSAVTPFGQVQPQGPYGPYSREPLNQTQQPSEPDHLLHGPAQQQTTYNGHTPYSYSSYASSQKEDPYSYPLPNQNTRLTQQPSPPGYSSYRPIDQQAPFSGSPTSTFSTAQQLRHQTSYGRSIACTPKEKSPTFQKHIYSHPEQSLPLTPVRPHGFDTDASDQHDDRPSAKRQTTPIEPGGGIPRFPDFDELSKPSAKPPTMKGDFRSAVPKTRTVTAADKKADFDREILPLMEQIRDLKRQMYQLTPQKGPPMRTGPEHARSLPTSLQLYNELEKRTMAATKSDREVAVAERRKQQYEENVRRKIQRGVERYLHIY